MVSGGFRWRGGPFGGEPIALHMASRLPSKVVWGGLLRRGLSSKAGPPGSLAEWLVEASDGEGVPLGESLLLSTWPPGYQVRWFGVACFEEVYPLKQGLRAV